MKKIIIGNLFIILLTGIFLYGRDHYSPVDSSSSTSPTANLNYKKQNEILSQEIIVLERNNYRLLSFIASLKNELKQKEQVNKIDHSQKQNYQILAKKEYELLKYKNKKIHANTVHAKLSQSMKMKKMKRAPASAPVSNDFESEEYKVFSSAKHSIAVGEDLMKVSKIYYNTHSKWRLIVKANPNIDMNKLEVGQVILVPNVAEEVVVWLDGKMVLKKDLPADRKPATIGEPEVE